MNAPDRFELFVLPEGSKKVTITKDTRMPNAATIEIQKEDHTLGNMLRMQLLKDPRVLFAGYKMPHPLDHYFFLKIQTTSDTTPWTALTDAVTELIGELGGIKTKFEDELRRVQEDREARRDAERSVLDAGYDNDF